MDWPKLEPNPYLDLHAPDDVRVRGTRVHLETLVDEYDQGREPEEIAREYPTLDAEAVYGVIAYILGHREAVDRYRTLCLDRDRKLEAEHDQKSDPPVVARLKALRATRQSA